MLGMDGLEFVCMVWVNGWDILLIVLIVNFIEVDCEVCL